MEQKEVKLSDVLARKRTDLADARTDLAVERTVMAASRSLMAWIRTGLSMIGFGFTAFKVLQSIQAQATTPALRPYAPRNVGLFLIGLGTISVFLGTIDYWNTNKQMKKRFGHKGKLFPLVFASSIVAIGLILFITIVFKIDIL